MKSGGSCSTYNVHKLGRLASSGPASTAPFGTASSAKRAGAALSHEARPSREGAVCVGIADGAGRLTALRDMGGACARAPCRPTRNHLESALRESRLNALARVGHRHGALRQREAVGARQARTAVMSAAHSAPRTSPSRVFPALRRDWCQVRPVLADQPTE